MSTKRNKIVVRGGVLSTNLTGTVNSIVFQENGRLRVSSSKKRRGYMKISKLSNDPTKKD